ncbi:hypothetical protein [uncultured Sphingomonas sp.]|uniref:hypothetical protein n=2 Tax=unclassified Sphingomonas TaxID=196159 RepID=UPI00262C67AB|nr:hypothetical protein [uncultured Sphingomonas sp.]
MPARLVVEDCARFISSAAIKAQRLALVLGPGLAWMQAKRMIVRERVAAFDDPVKASAWLLSGEPMLERPIDEVLLAKTRQARHDLR